VWGLSKENNVTAEAQHYSVKINGFTIINILNITIFTEYSAVTLKEPH
jgi:hypothetical protein